MPKRVEQLGTCDVLLKRNTFARVLVTGGAGFIGSHLVDRLCGVGVELVVLDNLTAGTLSNVSRWLNELNFRFVRGDLLEIKDLSDILAGCEAVFHLAANPEVRLGFEDPKIHYEQNVGATFNLLEGVRKADGVHTFVFTSSSTVYGEPTIMPTPENYAPLKPISVYGASKLASEALITGYAKTYGFKAVIHRLANIVGPRARHGVIHDFIMKLRRNPRELEILGDGTQTKSYLYVDDCVDAMLISVDKSRGGVETYNVGSEDQINVREIADIVCEEMGLKNVEYRFTGGVDGGRGWKGDVKYMFLDVGKLKRLGWRPKLDSGQAVRKTVKALLKEKLLS